MISYYAVVTGSLTVNGDLIVTGTGSMSSSAAISSSYAYSASSAVSSYTASSAINASASLVSISSSYAQTASYANTFTVGSTLTAQTLVVQTITSSIDYITGSARFGSSSSNTFDFTGSVRITGSTNIVGNLQITTGSVGIGMPVNAGVGIYLSAPSSANQALSVFDFAKTRGITFYPSYTGQANTHLITSDYAGASYYNLALSARTNAVDFFISSSGNIGIGTTNPSSGSLQIATPGNNGNNQICLTGGNAYTNTYLGAFSGTTYITNNYSYLSGHRSDNAGLKSMEISFDTEQIMLNVMPAGTPGTRTRLLHVSSSGNVGIGTTSPGSKLHLYDGTNPLSLKIQRTTVPVYLSDVATASTTAGSAWSHNMENTSNGSFTWGGFTNSGYAGSAIMLNADTSTSWITFHTANAVNTNPTERMRITGAGTVNITSAYNSLQTSTKTTGSGATVNFGMGSDYGLNVSGNDNISGLVIINISQTNTNITQASAVWVGTVNNPRGTGATLTQITRTLGGGISALTVSNSSNTITVSATTTDSSNFRASMTFIGGGGTS